MGRHSAVLCILLEFKGTGFRSKLDKYLLIDLSDYSSLCLSFFFKTIPDTSWRKTENAQSAMSIGGSMLFIFGPLCPLVSLFHQSIRICPISVSILYFSLLVLVTGEGAKRKE